MLLPCSGVQKFVYEVIAGLIRGELEQMYIHEFPKVRVN